MSKSFLDQVGERIKFLRDYRGIGRRRLAYLCGVSYVEIAEIEMGLVKAPFSLYEDICRVMGHTTDDLFGHFRWKPVTPLKESSLPGVDAGKIA